MADNSKIQWTDHTVNFWTGCIKVSTGCKFCYMYRDMDRYNKDATIINKVSEKTIFKTLKQAQPGDKIFTCSWSDFFIEEADEFRTWAWDIIRQHPHLNWQILTKRPERILNHLPEDWGNGWPNVWLGISAENQETFSMRMLYFSVVPAHIRFLSLEPLLGPINFWPWANLGREMRSGKYGSAFDWIIIGGESGNNNGKWHYRHCDKWWIEEIIEQCENYNIPVFVKQLGTSLAKKMLLKDRHGGNIHEWPNSLKTRQFPNKQ